MFAAALLLQCLDSLRRHPFWFLTACPRQVDDAAVISARPLGLRDGSTNICRFESEFDAAEVVSACHTRLCLFLPPERMVYETHMLVLCRLKVL